MNKDAITFLKESLPFWDSLKDTQKDLLLQNLISLKYRKGEIVHQAQNTCKGVLLIQSGTLRAYMLSDEGKEITLYRIQSPQVCILSASCALSCITFDVFIEAEEDSQVLQIPSSIFSRLFSDNIYVEAFAYKQTTQRFSDVMWAMQQILFISLDRRLAGFLIEKSQQEKTQIIKMTHEQMAKDLGSAREVISRMLKYFASEGFVELFRGGVRILDLDGLKKLV